jgi:hypothetical protein
MKHMLKAMLIAGALGTSAFLTAPAADAQYYHRPGVSVTIGVGDRSGYYRRDYYRHAYSHRRYYHRAYYDNWRYRCDRWHRYNCGRHYGLRHRYRSW